MNGGAVTAHKDGVVTDLAVDGRRDPGCGESSDPLTASAVSLGAVNLA